MSASPVSADDVDLAVHSAITLLRRAETDAWDYRAGRLKWTCWETVEHIADDLFFFATQLGPRIPPLEGPVPFACESKRSGGPAVSLRAERTAGPEGLLMVLESCGALLSAMVRTKPNLLRAYHAAGVSDPEGFAAMGVVEVLVHTHDLAEGLGLDFTPSPDLCERVLARLFPGAPDDVGPWSALLWSTGRVKLPGRPRQGEWQWSLAPVER